MLRYDPTLAEEIAHTLVNSHVVQYNATVGFRLASGLYSPIYVDLRGLLGNVPVRGAIISELVEYANEHLIKPSNDPMAILGAETGGIPFASILADHLNLPCGYVRKVQKNGGLSKMIEGGIEHPYHAILLEELVTTGRSATDFIGTILVAGAGMNTSGVLSIVNYGFPHIYQSRTNFHTLTTVQNIARVGSLVFGAQYGITINTFLHDPEGWSAACAQRRGQLNTSVEEN